GVLRRQQDVAKRLRVADEIAIDQIARALVARIDEEAVDEVCELVAGGAGDLPAGPQRLVMGEDLLHHDVERPAIVGRVRTREVLQLPAVSSGVEETVDVVETDALDTSLTDHAAEQPVRGLEQRPVLHPDAGELVDVEETPVVDLVGADAP